MTAPPQTRHSLILRIRDREDADSWREFVSIYEPVIYKVAVRRGMQHADAMELVQRVLLAVARTVDRFQPDSSRAKFRTWLFRITHNEFCKQYQTLCKHSASGDSAVHRLLDEHADPRHPHQQSRHDDFSMEYRRAIFRWAAERVKPKVKPSTWQAFWMTSVENKSSEEAARETGLSVGAVYIARSRVMARLQQVAAKYEERTS